MRNLALVGLAVLAGCSAVDPAEDLANSAKKLPGLDNYVIVIPKELDPQVVVDAAKLKCAGKTHCSVFGWDDAAKAASALPMLEQEQEALSFKYILNRSTGTEQTLWKCGNAAANPKECI